MTDIRTFASAYLDELERATRNIDPQTLQEIVSTLWSAYEEKRTIYVFGNGGSAATASHFTTDLAKGTLGHKGDLPVKGFKVISLNDNMALLTAWANDAGYENVFAGQLQRLIEPGDVVIAISASGNSPNVLAGVELAARAGATIIGLAGFDGGRLATMCDYVIIVDSFNYGVVEDAHMCLTHILAQNLGDQLAEALETEREAILSNTR